jgi:hypothetical protein
MSEVKSILLPKVILAKILGFLKIYIYLRSRQVCKNWRNTLIDRKSINIKSMNSKSILLIFNNTILTNVIKLNISMCNVTDATLLHLNKLVNLQELNLSYNPEITNQGLIYLYDLINLRILNLEYCKNITNLNQFINFYKLEELNITGCFGIKKEEFKYLINLINLQILDVSQFYITKIHLKYISLCSQLKYLRLSQCGLQNRISNLHMLKNLLHLDISICSNITDNELYHLKVFTKLLTLNISNCLNITNNGLYYLSMLENLEILMLSNRHINNKTIIHLNNCKKLKRIGIKYMKRINNYIKNIRPGLIFFDYR